MKNHKKNNHTEAGLAGRTLYEKIMEDREKALSGKYSRPEKYLFLPKSAIDWIQKNNRKI